MPIESIEQVLVGGTEAKNPVNIKMEPELILMDDHDEEVEFYKMMHVPREVLIFETIC